MEKELFEEMYKVEAKHWWFMARRKIIGNVIQGLELGKNIQILDAGCGNGDNLELLSLYGDVLAMERDDNALGKAQKRGIGKVVKGQLPNGIPECLSKDNDLIVMLDVLEHIDDDALSLSVLKTCAKEGGTLIITVPAYEFLWTSHDEQHHHKRRYTVKRLKELVEEREWKVKYVSYFNTFLFPLALVDRIRQKFFPLKKDTELKVPNNFINLFFNRVFGLESCFIGKYSFPFGLSIMLVAENIKNEQQKYK